MSRVDVILTSYNRDVLLEEAIESVLSQTYSDYHLYIVDDDSDNVETHKVLNKYINLPNVTIYKEKLNGEDRYSRNGYAKNINKAIKNSHSEFLTYLTCDDIYYRDRLSRMVYTFDANPNYFVVFGVQNMVRLNDDFSTTFISKRDPGPIVANASCRVDHNSVMHKRACIDLLNIEKLWDENPATLGAGDAAVWDKLNTKWPFYRIGSTPTDEHRLHKNSIQKL